MAKKQHKRKSNRVSKKTILLYCEGKSDEYFCKHLKALFNTNIIKSITIRGGRGGSPNDIVNCASRILGAFDTRVVILDSDKTAAEMEKARIYAKKKKIDLIENTPCLEMLLLQILDYDFKGKRKDSHSLKKLFESEYIPASKRTDMLKYSEIFPKESLERKITVIPILKTIVDLLSD